jgi:hypothetical protein
MRRIVLAGLALAIVSSAFVGTAWGEPTASLKSFKVLGVPITKQGGGTWPNTGNCLGCGTGLQLEYQLEGSGYGVTTQNPTGGVPPTSQINLYLPAGVTLHPAGFPTCSPQTLMDLGPQGCIAGSVAGPVGLAYTELTFGTERVQEEAELRPFFGPGGNLLFYIAGHSPVSLEIVSQGHFEKSSAPYGEDLIIPLPPVVTVPGAPLLSFQDIYMKLGAAFMQGETRVSYFTMPTECEVGGLPFKSEVTFGGEFGGERDFGIPAKTVIGAEKTSCPVASNERVLTVSLGGSGAGTVTGGGISCPGSCSNSYPVGTMVTLTATPEEGSVFSGWSGGGCSGSGTCTVTMSSEKAVSATFTASPHGGGGGGASGGGGSSSGPSTASQTGNTAASVGTAQIAALMDRQLTPSGKTAKIAALLKAGGFLGPFQALEAGTAVIDWYQLPPGAKLAKAKVKPILVAAGQMTFSAAGTGMIKVKLTTAGTRLLKHAKSLKLTAKGTFIPTGKRAVVATKAFVLKR